MPSLIGNTRRPDITVRWSGVIHVSARVVRLLGLKPGFTLDVVRQDDGECMMLGRPHGPEWDGAHRAQLRRANVAGDTLRTNCAALARALLALVPGSPKAASLPCGAVVPSYRGDGSPAIPIIIKNPLHTI